MVYFEFGYIFKYFEFFNLMQRLTLPYFSVIYFCCLLTHVISMNTETDCDIHVTVVRQLENEGFHRDLHSLVEIVAGRSVVQKQHCSLVLQETLPDGLFVNPDQLDDLNRFGVVSACANTSVDVEAPQYSSKALSVLIYSKLTRTENLLSADLKLPIHARYHSPQPGGGYQSVVISLPNVLLRCAGHLNCPHLKKHLLPCYPCSKELCSWTQLLFKTNAESLKMFVPVGNTLHFTLVTVITLLVTSGGCIYILSVLAGASTS